MSEKETEEEAALNNAYAAGRSAGMEEAGALVLQRVDD